MVVMVVQWSSLGRDMTANDVSMASQPHLFSDAQETESCGQWQSVGARLTLIIPIADIQPKKLYS